MQIEPSVRKIEPSVQKSEPSVHTKIYRDLSNKLEKKQPKNLKKIKFLGCSYFFFKLYLKLA